MAAKMVHNTRWFDRFCEPSSTQSPILSAFAHNNVLFQGLIHSRNVKPITQQKIQLNWLTRVWLTSQAAKHSVSAHLFVLCTHF